MSGAAAASASFFRVVFLFWMTAWEPGVEALGTAVEREQMASAAGSAGQARGAATVVGHGRPDFGTEVRHGGLGSYNFGCSLSGPLFQPPTSDRSAL